MRAAERDQAIGIAGQKAEQAVKEEARVTAQKAMAVVEVNTVRQAEIERQSELVVADRMRQVAVIAAEAGKQRIILEAEGNLENARRHAEGIQVEGVAKGEAEKAVLLAPVTAQITLAHEIGENADYQNYLLTIRNIEATQAVGIEQAKALAHADVRVISNAGNPVDGIKNVMDLVSSKGGLQIGAMLEGLGATPVGNAVLNAAVAAAKPKSGAAPNGAARD